MFSDLWITLEHLRLAAAGADPLSDPNSGFAYPRAVLALHHIGLHHIPAEWLGLLQGIMVTTAVIVVLRPVTRRRAVVTALILLTPSMLLGFERGNVDFALFPLCVAAGLLWSRSERFRSFIAPLVALMAGALLKLYPIFAMLAATFAETGKRRLYWAGAIGVVFAYWIWIRDEFATVVGKIPVMTTSSWGARVSFARLEAYLQEAHPQLWLTGIDWDTLALGLYGVIIIVGAIIGLRLSERFATVRWSSEEWSYYWLGAGICCGCFAAANFVYRWVFALLTLPILLRCMRSRDPVVALWARVTIGALVVGLASKLTLTAGFFIITQLANWVCIFGLVVGCIALRSAAVLVTQPVAGVTDSEELSLAALSAKNYQPRKPLLPNTTTPDQEAEPSNL